MLALQHYRAELLCPCGCGWPKSVSMDPMTEWNLGEPQAFRCHIRTALVKAQRDGKDRPVPEGLMWSVGLRQAND